MSSRTRLSFSTTLNDSGQRIKIQISDPSGLQADNLALATWGSSEVLANALHRFDINFQHSGGLHDDVIPVLELGAGTGLVGLSAACVWGVPVVLTDLTPLLGALGANVELNKDLLAQHKGMAAVGRLDWSNPEDMTVVSSLGTYFSSFPHSHERSKARVILAADTVYSEEHPELLVNVITHRLEKSQEARLIICYPLRIGYLDHIRDLWARLEAAGFTCVKEGREEIDGSWEEDTPYEWCIWGWGIVHDES